MDKDKLKEFQGCGWLWYEHLGLDDVNVYMMARREFVLDKIPAKAEIKITADSRYKLYVNGNYVCFGPARGYPESYPFDRVNIAPHLKKGKNIIAVLVHQYGCHTFQSIYGGAAGLLVSGRIGRIDIGTKPKTWLVKKCPGHKQDMIRRTVQMGYQENFDSRLVNPLWKQPKANIKEGKDGWIYGNLRPVGCLPWLNLEERGIPLLKEEVKNFKQICKLYSGKSSPGWEDARNLTELYLREQQGTDISGKLEDRENMLKPDPSVTEISPFSSQKRLTLIVDFGEETVGYLGIKAEAEGGEVIDFTTAESLKKGWLCVTNPNIGPRVATSDRFILRKGKNNLETFAIHGFRYLAITFRNIKKPLKISHLYIRQSRYPFEKETVFNSSDETLNNIWRMCVRTQANCSLDAYVDTPWREQAQWWGDAKVQAANTYYAFGDMRLFRRGIKQAGQSQLPNGLTRGHFPTMPGNVLPDFTLVWIHTHLDYYDYTADKSLLKEQFPKIQKAMAFFQDYVNKNYLLGPMPEWWVFLDWAPLYKEGYSCLFNLIYLSSLRTMAEICNILRKQKEENHYKAQARIIEKRVKQTFWDKTEKVFWDGFDIKKKKPIKKISQHVHCQAILLDLEPKYHRQWAEKILLPPMKLKPLVHKTIIEGSPYYYYYIINALKRIGGYDKEIINFIKTRWGKMLEDGAITCYEIWDPTPGANSLSHAWSAHPIVHLSNILLGIWQEKPGWKQIRFCPTFTHADCLNGRVVTPYGSIKADWKKTKDKVNVRLKLPAGITANVVLPGKKRERITGGGRWVVEEFVRGEDI